MQIGGKKAELAKLIERLHDPLQLRVFVTGCILLVGYVGLYMPLSGRIDDTARKLSKERARYALIEEVERLRAEVDKFQARLPEKTDTNEWVQYVLEGSREFPIKLINLSTRSPERVGPYEAVVLHVEVAGTFHDLDSFLHWLETNERLFRVDSARIARARTDNNLVMQFTLLGMKG